MIIYLFTLFYFVIFLMILDKFVIYLLKKLAKDKNRFKILRYNLVSIVILFIAAGFVFGKLKSLFTKKRGYIKIAHKKIEELDKLA